MDTGKSILFLGDVAPYKPLRFDNTINTVINLECPITTRGTPVAGKIILGTAENHLGSIFNSNLLCVNLANNHILDYGIEGLESTIEELEKSGIPYFGINDREGHNPLILNIGDLKIAFLSAVCQSTSPIFDYDKVNYLTPFNPENILGKISAARDLAERVVVYLHLGQEESSLPAGEDVKFVRSLIDGGADVVIGSHAHSPQAVERYKNGIIAHNLGNFMMPEMKDVPSYFNEEGFPGSLFSSRTMLWNRISWGIVADMSSMEFKIKKFLFTPTRVVELPFTPYDRFLRIPVEINEGYEKKVAQHQKFRALQRKLVEFIYKPHIPKMLKP
jgi:poly-gamma-glutamate synthesis protein (capsule biosynthesis protein)